MRQPNHDLPIAQQTQLVVSVPDHPVAILIKEM